MRRPLVMAQKSESLFMDAKAKNLSFDENRDVFASRFHSTFVAIDD